VRILITHPYCWPYVRRGSERFMAELSQFLVRRGHEVTNLSTSPHAREEEYCEGVRIVRERQISLGWIGEKDLIRPETPFALICRRFLDNNSFDVIHCLYHADVLGAMWSERSRRTPCVFHITGIPFARWVRRHPWETGITRLAIRHASRVLVVSNYAARMYNSAFGASMPKQAISLNIPCNLSLFSASVARDQRSPRILFMGALTENRKGALPLALAFNLVRRNFPGAKLQYCGEVTDRVRESVMAAIAQEHRQAVEFLGKGQLEDLPRLYAEAAVTVLPSVAEAFGMVLVESLASGTPVVGSNDAGTTDIVEPGVGRLFDPRPVDGVASNVSGLAEAIGETLALHLEPGLAARCRQSARRFGWERLGLAYERIYQECAGRKGIAA
jgi:phosphatidyl-myo-inositol alpha-mannosyltransferase